MDDMVFYTVRRRFESCQGHQVFSPDPFGEYVPCCVELVSQDGVSERNPLGIHQPHKTDNPITPLSLWRWLPWTWEFTTPAAWELFARHWSWETTVVVREKGKTRSNSTAMFSAGYEIFLALLSLLSIFNLILLIIIGESILSAILILTNFVLLFFFGMDFVIRLIKSPSKSEYLFRQYGWADFLSCLPFSQTNIFRLFRLIKVYRLLKEFGVRKILHAIVKDRADTALFILIFVTILMLEFGSMGMLAIEPQSPDANITTAQDALWYLVVTLSTVGYGDQYPVTTEGRLLGAFIILTGVGIFGTLTGYLANFFLSPKKKQKPQDELSDIRSQLHAIKALSAQQQDAIATLEKSLNKGDD